ncbi:carboxylesterase/lipase family protein [Paraburkholderia rhizosphaerae]|uniref:Para-nitrobenzyl esterase n=1 Tax=Paraburkholderia rhizosphaerae TaxID=480658 RepID=A0A4R8LTH3_9BURK|nr:carboxylesterase family protein [Paraburkholderia rhizosphaerae]TDY51003.1 para-nitrobenzyl esterase [Paraburkholderia rhizosphaerae]
MRIDKIENENPVGRVEVPPGPGRSLMRRLGALTIVASLVAAWVHTASAHPPTKHGEPEVIEIDSGALIGTTVRDAVAYLGIPYAAPPVGNLRWRPPQPPVRWKGSLHADHFGHTCAQNTDYGVFSSASMNEDCLNLNVYTPPGASTRRSRLPVMFFVHGGGNKVGEGDDYDGSEMAVKGNVIVVTINYRLGALGYLAHPALDGTNAPFGNYGFMDQLFALQWVQHNIHKFNGDPGNVTIFGQSSGGGTVLADLIAPAARGLFHKAIIQSGAFQGFKQIQIPKAAAEAKGVGFANAVGCADQTAECLRSVPVSEILAKQGSFLLSGGGLVFDPKSMLPRTFQDAFASGDFAHVPLINGSNGDDARWNVALPEEMGAPPLTSDGYPAAVTGFWGPALQPLVLEQYPSGNYPSPSIALATAETDYLYACVAHKLNNTLSTAMPVYAYEFNDKTTPAYMPTVSFHFRAYHTAELQYIFPHYHGGTGSTNPLNFAQHRLSDEMIELWTKFASARGNEPWPDHMWAKYDPTRQRMESFQSEGSTSIDGRSFAQRHRCDIWDSLALY